MKIFLDANILVSVLNKEYPLFPFTSRILSLSDNSRYQLYTSPVCLAIAFYFAEKKHRTTIAKQKMDLLCQYIRIAPATEQAVSKTLNNQAIHDFEDGIEYYSAIESGCQCIITENTGDFYFSELEVADSREFCSRYLVKR
ncbi:PIN domain-containing protein [Arcticibacter tournemirensis]|uniref:PIN domain-containing protein n=1 Tax=Arcticibacter tournemirensis TaxID=699437 RepID=A0A5M9GJY2_9SPHI|nr:PIN domain-containing protein [Arcticibacter tournemirensis]KAA8474257.1 PIN domain-containing protein [Arcticibacter tournemirensis]TQM51221.1 PIN domain-containing protein [Arcticibacter tournemirensis]